MGLLRRLADWWEAPHPAEDLQDGPSPIDLWNQGEFDLLEGGFTGAEVVSDLSVFGISPFFGCTKSLSDLGSILDLNVYTDDNELVTDPMIRPAWTRRVPIRGFSPWSWKKRSFMAQMTRGFTAYEIVTRHPLTRQPDLLEPLSPGYRFLTLEDNTGILGYGQPRDSTSPVRVRYSSDGGRSGRADRVLTEWMGPHDMEGDCLILRFDDDGTLEGRSILRSANRVLSLAMATAGHAELFHRTGGRPLWMISAEPGTTQESLDELEQNVGRVRASKYARFQALMVAGKVDVKELTSTAKESQLVEARDLSVREICRLFNYPVQLMGESGTTWGQGMSELKRAVLAFSLRPWLKCITDGLNMTLPDGLTAKFDTAEAQRGDPEKHVESIVKACGGPYKTVNEGRREDGLQDIEGGDVVRSSPVDADSGDEGDGADSDEESAPAPTAPEADDEEEDD